MLPADTLGSQQTLHAPSRHPMLSGDTGVPNRHLVLPTGTLNSQQTPWAPSRHPMLFQTQASTNNCTLWGFLPRQPSVPLSVKYCLERHWRLCPQVFHVSLDNSVGLDESQKMWCGGRSSYPEVMGCLTCGNCVSCARTLLLLIL